MDSFFRNWHVSVKKSQAACAVTAIGFLVTSPSSLASDKISAILFTQESMQEHTSDEPRRLMCGVLLDEFAKGNIVQIVNRENSKTLSKAYYAPYHVGANLIAFSFAPQTPIHVSLSIQLLEKKSGNVFLTSDRALVLDEKAVEAGLRLRNSEFDNSAYGKALAYLSRAAAKQFEEKVKQLNLPVQK